MSSDRNRNRNQNRHRCRAAAASALVVIGLAAQAQAAPVIVVLPVSQTVNHVANFTVDIVARDLDGAAVGGYHLSLTWDLLYLDYVDTDPDGNWMNDTFTGSGGDGSFEWTLVGDVDPFVIGANTLRLAQLSFARGAPGTTTLDVTSAVLYDDALEPIAGVTAQDAVVCVAPLDITVPGVIRNDPACRVPEPTVVSMLAAGVAAAVVRRRASKRRQ